MQVEQVETPPVKHRLVIIGLFTVYLSLAVVAAVWSLAWLVALCIGLAFLFSLSAFAEQEEFEKRFRLFRRLFVVVAGVWLTIFVVTLVIKGIVNSEPSPAPKPVVQIWET